MKELKKINIEDGKFSANGKTYLIETSMSISRYVFYEKIEAELGYGRSFSEIYDGIMAAMNDINAQAQGEAYVKLYNIANGIRQIERKKPHVLRYCALFINEENEDRGTINEDMINAKINDWEKEGIDYAPFFEFALISLPGFRERYKRLTPNSSKEISNNNEKEQKPNISI